MPSLNQLSTAQLRQALQLREQIDAMQQKLEAILGGPVPTESSPAAKAKGARSKAGKRTMSAEGREKIAAAARARWAKIKSGSGKAAKAAAPVAKAVKAKGAVVKEAGAAPKAAAPQKRKGLTDEGRARLAAAMKARWAARKKGAAA